VTASAGPWGGEIRPKSWPVGRIVRRAVLSGNLRAGWRPARSPPGTIARHGRRGRASPGAKNGQPTWAPGPPADCYRAGWPNVTGSGTAGQPTWTGSGRPAGLWFSWRARETGWPAPISSRPTVTQGPPGPARLWIRVVAPDRDPPGSARWVWPGLSSNVAASTPSTPKADPRPVRENTFDRHSSTFDRPPSKTSRRYD